MNIMGSEKYKQAEDDYEEASDSSQKIFNLNTRYPYIDDYNDNQFFGECKVPFLLGLI